MRRVLFYSYHYHFFEVYGRFKEKTAIFLRGMMPYASYSYEKDECIKLVGVCGSFETPIIDLINQELNLWNRTLRNLPQVYFLSLPRELALTLVDSYYNPSSSSPIVNDSRYLPIAEAVYGFLNFYHHTQYNCYSVDLGDTILFRLRYTEYHRFFARNFRGIIV